MASTGFGYGDTDVIAGTEALIGGFADEATTNDGLGSSTGQPIGLALVDAKRQYLGSLSTVTPYDAKSSTRVHDVRHAAVPARVQDPRPRHRSADRCAEPSRGRLCGAVHKGLDTPGADRTRPDPADQRHLER